ncbi:hypothetical protein [Escherichia coli]|uniref:hypothetical protein n=1 Tax=Escherichia coli TaxID=562 RepID=UPI001060BAC8|nr:hypothetical protein [Escherichia coli]VEW03943.1 conserved hypothetical protein [Escherichia coli]
MINGVAPYVGARVYDIQQGFGTITQVEPDMSFVVDLGGGRVLRYSQGGYVGNSRRVYWKNPIIVEPVDDDRTWDTFVTVAKSVRAMLVNADKAVPRG